MSTMTNWTANPSSLALPAYGRVLGMPGCAQVDIRMSGGATETISVRAHVTGIVAGRTKFAFPGTSAWRPPIC